MTPITPVSVSFLPIRSRPVQNLSSVSEPAQPVSVEPVRENPPDPVLLNRLPQGPALEMLDHYRHINLLAHQAAELDQTIENRAVLQRQVSRDLSELRAVFDDLKRDELELFLAVFENQVPEFSSSTTGNDTGVFPEVFADNSLERLLRVDVTSEPGFLSALDLAGSVIDVLSGIDTGSGFLESLLEYLTDVPPVVLISDNPIPEPEEEPVSSDSDTAVITEESPSPEAPGSDPPTIIELTG